jgi:hypothetical protein
MGELLGFVGLLVFSVGFFAAFFRCERGRVVLTGLARTFRPYRHFRAGLSHAAALAAGLGRYSPIRFTAEKVPRYVSSSAAFLSPLRGWFSFSICDPRLAPWATFFRRFAARSPAVSSCFWLKAKSYELAALQPSPDLFASRTLATYSTVTDAWAPLTVIACSPGSRAPPRVMVSGV